MRIFSQWAGSDDSTFVPLETLPTLILIMFSRWEKAQDVAVFCPLLLFMFWRVVEWWREGNILELGEEARMKKIRAPEEKIGEHGVVAHFLATLLIWARPHARAA
jgi:hypothetical protein